MSDSRIFSTANAALLSTAIISALGEARALVQTRNFGPELQDVVRHARDVLDDLRRQIAAADAKTQTHAREVLAAMSERIHSLEALVAEECAKRPTTGH